MAASDAQPLPVKGKALRVTAPVFDTAGALVTTSTTAVTISKDQGTFGNPNAGATNATQIATTSGVWYVDLDATDLSCDTLAVKFANGSNPVTVLVVYTLDLSEPGAVPAWTSKFGAVVSWLLALNRNKMTQTSTTTTLRNDADGANLATSTVTDSAGTFTRGEWA